jgi:hypothetical protein
MQTNVIQQLFQAHFPALADDATLPVSAFRAGMAISRCRTGAYGHHIEQCRDGCTTRVRYHSCHHRSCPQCNAVPRARWLEQQQARLLDCEHYHIIFTVPAVFRRWWEQHPEIVTADLFWAAKEALFRLCADARYLGATPGLLAGFHSWSRRLLVHPHVHCLVSAEGLTAQGEWRRAKRTCFLPARLLMATFRALLLKRWRRRARAGEWSAALGDVTSVLERQARRPWSVQVQPRYRHGRGVAIYLARYLRGGPCHARQLVLHPGQVTLLPKQAERHAAVRTLTGEAFVRSWLTHVPRLRQRTVRGYGLYAAHGAAVTARNASRSAAPVTVTAVARVFAVITTCCPQCGQPLLSPWQAARAQAPP